MSSWTVIGWCLATVAVIGTLFVVATAVGAVIGFIKVFVEKTEEEKRVAAIKKSRGLK